MLNSKQRAFLRSKSNQMETIFQVGKGGIGETLVKQVNDALTAREMIKLRVLESSLLTAREAGEALAEECHAELVCAIGTRFVLFRRNPKKPIYEFDV